MSDETDNSDEPSDHEPSEADNADFSDTEQTQDPDEVVATGFQVDDEPQAASIDAQTGETLDSEPSAEQTGEEADSAEEIFAAEGDFDQQPDGPFGETSDQPAPGMEPDEASTRVEDVHDTQTSPAGYDSATDEFDTPPDQFDAAEASDFAGAKEDSASTSPDGYDPANLPEEALPTGQEEDTAAADDEYDPDASFDGADGAEQDDQLAAEGAQLEEEEQLLVLQEELSDIQNPSQADPVDVEALPEVGPYLQPATLTLYVDGQEQESYALEADSLILGRAGQNDLPAPDIDLGAFAADAPIWQRHLAIYRQNKNYVAFVAADGATQLNETLLQLGDYRRLKDGDVLIVGGTIGLEFALPEDKSTAAMETTTEAEQPDDSPAESFDESGADAFGESDAGGFDESGAEPLDEGEFDSEMPPDSGFDAGADTNAGQSDVPFD